jgi:GntR family transcriptional regulator, transcriptional repressor for pyruvate dehydrogenase complex
VNGSPPDDRRIPDGVARVAKRRENAGALEPIARVSLKDTIIERLGRLISEQEMKPGAQLPPEVQLARRFGVGRSSVREAVSALVSYGVLARRAGHGTYVTSRVGQLITRPLALRLTLDPESFRYVLEARKVLEGEFAYLAALRADAEDLDAIEGHLDAMRIHARNPEISIKEDFAFHMAIARSAKNPVLFDVLNDLSDLVFGSHRAVTQSGGLSPGAMAYHVHIAKAIRRRLPRVARRVMLQHLDNVIRRADELYGTRLRPVSLAGGRVTTAGTLPSGLSSCDRGARSSKIGKAARPTHLTRER